MAMPRILAMLALFYSGISNDLVYTYHTVLVIRDLKECGNWRLGEPPVIMMIIITEGTSW